MDTYPLIVLIKLDFPAPESPVIAMSTFTSCHTSILLLNNFAMEPGLRRPFFSTSFWKSCTHFDSQFIAKGRLKTEGYANESGPRQRQGFIMLRPAHVTRHFRFQCLCVSLFIQSYPEGGRRIEVTKVKAFWVGQEQTARFWPPISACRLQRYSFLLWQFPTVSDNS